MHGGLPRNQCRDNVWQAVAGDAYASACACDALCVRNAPMSSASQRFITGTLVYSQFCGCDVLHGSTGVREHILRQGCRAKPASSNGRMRIAWQWDDGARCVAASLAMPTCHLCLRANQGIHGLLHTQVSSDGVTRRRRQGRQEQNEAKYIYSQPKRPQTGTTHRSNTT